MKTSVLFLVIFSILVLGGNSFAQLELKPAVGVNFSNFSKDPTSGEQSAKVGWQLGGTVSVGEKFYGEGGIFWVNKSTEFKESSTNNTFSNDFSGIRIPAMVGYHLLGKEGDILGLRGFGGASAFILTSTKNPFDIPKDDFTSVTWGLFLGAGVDISMFFVDVKYEWSLSNVSSVSSFDVGKSKTLFINGGVRISL
jgi:hypothetical protein